MSIEQKIDAVKLAQEIADLNNKIIGFAGSLKDNESQCQKVIDSSKNLILAQSKLIDSTKE
jgi:hypothetical protein